MNRKGFTLIELLVVIAIIAILAAILFPVFAQAKAAAKKSASLSNLKQLGTSIQIYLADHDDLFPLAYVPGDSRGYNFDRLVPVPKWFTPASAHQESSMDCFWGNSIQPYVKNLDIYNDPITAPVERTQAVYGSVAPPASVTNLVSYSFNSLLNGYSGTSVANVSNLPLLWTGRGKAGLRGWGYASPYMICRNPLAPCVYVPSSASCDSNINGHESGISKNSSNTGWDIHSGGMVFSRTDSSTKWIKTGAYSSGATNPLTDPFTHYFGTKEPTLEWYDQYGCHAYMFRPDFDFTSMEPANAF